MTAFTSRTVTLWDDLVFHLDGNDKITRDDGAYGNPAANAFSLPHISTCPGSTPDCRSSCYVHGLQANAQAVYETYRDNERAIHAVLLTNGRAARAADLLASAIDTQSFRWHVSGDVFSRRYAQWIAAVCDRTRDVEHWIYTRTLSAVPHLRAAPNLVVNVSADASNFREASACAKANGARLCYFTRDGDVPRLPVGSVIFPDYSLRGRNGVHPSPWWRGLSPAGRRMVCPADYFGQSRQHRCGPCVKCLR